MKASPSTAAKGLTTAKLTAVMLASAMVLPSFVTAAEAKNAAFEIVPLGVEGGILEGRTTAWFIAPSGGKPGLTCDAGTLVPGIRDAIRRGAFPSGSKPATILHDRIRAYLITHPHLDHVAGLVMASPDDDQKPIFALPAVNEALAHDYFNWSAWPNMGDRGIPPLLRRYAYQDLPEAGTPVEIGGTDLTVTAYPLSHGGALSTAFLIRNADTAVLCMGDTGPDAVERSDRLDALWRAMAPLVRDGTLRAILVETSYPDPRPAEQLFGHLTPYWLNRELDHLAKHVGGETAMKHLSVVIGHIKPAIDDEPATARTIAAQLAAGRNVPIRYIIARQGRRIGL